MTTAASRSRSARRRPGRPRGQDSAVVREAALVAAMELIARQGFAATSMSQVAHAAGISPSGLAHHFRSKQALLGAVLARRDELDAVPPRPDEDEPWRAYRELVDLARHNMDNRQIVALFMTMVGEAVAPEHPAHEWMLRHYRDVLAQLTAQVRTDQEAGRVREDAPAERIARETIALMDGLQVQWLLDPEVDMSRAMAEHLADLRRCWDLAP
ncbi:TetR/AcrR family transcriptional regulator [Brachybacterium saurashtrense]|uniref:TetR/AcrR family transcriptional regulator n=1 Tax=Brachybacterium saurashtrense TaxID=556288 RepID=A0A345YJW8_9MICO|nr:TetR/AcrR family transcriptional regulator [Brachybacterium saurashtrense]AXK44220.1 TetR/AcrR family transcriptional regulator [Brachybacterium saurashtrense]RRR21492.1 TetR/AcrR family transcriptional regulator [Brachybacterium saurashtrense]